MLFNDFEMFRDDLEMLFYEFEMIFNDLRSTLIKFVRSRDPVGEKTTKIGTYKGGRRALACLPPL